ncbi:MAG TPA: transposase [Pyrinomonadaceae bacterium]
MTAIEAFNDLFCIVILPQNRTIEKWRFPDEYDARGSDEKSKLASSKIIGILKAVEAGRTARDMCREHQVSEATYYKWKANTAAWSSRHSAPAEVGRGTGRLKHMYSELSLEHRILMAENLSLLPSEKVG